MSILDEAVILNNGSLIPKLGVTVTKTEKMAEALRLGFRLFDLSAVNNLALPEIKKENFPWQQISLQTTVPNTWAPEHITSNLNRLLNQWQISHLDLVVLEAGDEQDKNYAAWQILSRMQQEGKIKNLGVKDFYLDALQDLLQRRDRQPVIEQMNVVDPQLATFLQDNNLRLQQSLNVPDEDGLAEIAQKHHVSVQQVVIAYELRQGKVMLLDENKNLTAAANLNLTLKADEERQLTGLLGN